MGGVGMGWAKSGGGEVRHLLLCLYLADPSCMHVTVTFSGLTLLAPWNDLLT